MTSLTRPLFAKISAADKIRMLYTKNLRPKAPAHSLLTENEVTNHRTLFSYFDKNRDGQLDQREYRDLVTFETTTRLADSNIKDVFFTHDSNADGLLSESEFLQSRRRLRTWIPSQFDLYNLFHTCDSNADNKLSFKEFRTMWSQLGEDPRRRDLKDIFDDFDRNKDGLITRGDAIRLIFHKVRSPAARRSKWHDHVTFKRV